MRDIFINFQYFSNNIDSDSRKIFSFENKNGRNFYPLNGFKLPEKKKRIIK
jgi:hypothetical protein